MSVAQSGEPLVRQVTETSSGLEPSAGWSWRNSFSRIEALARELSHRKNLTLALVALATILLRLSVLWLMPVPVPTVHDEFSYLLAADTFVHGRLTNPTHPMWLYLDTIHVNQQPTYMSKYPPAQGIVLAVGMILGHPWIGVLLSVAGMCAAITWMLQGWLPPQWALLGGLLVVLRFAGFNYWIDSYWGGAVAAIGGALAMGALPRLLRRPQVRHALVLAAGLAILAGSRPVEGLIFSLPIAGTLVLWLFRPGMGRELKIKNALLPLALSLTAAACWLGYYNWRGTGSPFLFPYVVYQNAHFASPPLLIQHLPPPRHFQNPQFTDYSEEQREEYREHRSRFWLTIRGRIVSVLVFFLGPVLAVPIVTMPWWMRDRKIRLALIQVVISLIGLTLTAAFFNHYAAPLLGTIYLLAMQGMRHLRQWRIYRFMAGMGLTRLTVLVAIAAFPSHIAKTWYDSTRGISWNNSRMSTRARIAQDLLSTPEQHLVIVRYSPTHPLHQEWVYNGADVDHSKIIWAREIPGVDLTPLLEYFHGRRIWMVEPDRPDVQLRPYSATSNP